MKTWIDVDTLLLIIAGCLIILVMPTLFRFLFGIIAFCALIFGGTLYCAWLIMSKFVDVVRELVSK